MTASVRLQVERSELAEKINQRLADGEMTPEQRAELTAWTERAQQLEPEIRAALVAEDAVEEVVEVVEGLDAEQRERVTLRGKVRITNYLEAAQRGRVPSGAEHELSAAAGVGDNIPFEAWESHPGAEQRAEHRVVTPAPGTGGTNLDVLRPAVFAPSVVDKLMVDMPRVESGVYASGTITTKATSDAVKKGADVPETAAAFTVQTTDPHRIGGSVNLALEDIARIGQDNFESLLREHISLTMSESLDDELLNGTGSTGGTDNELIGFFQRLDNAADPAANAETWARFLAIQASGVDGLWASELSHVGIVCGVASYRLAAATFQGTDSEESAASYLKRMGSDPYAFVTNSRMPAAVNSIQKGILCRKGRSMMPAPMRLAVAPQWGSFTIDDIYTGALKGERRYVMSMLVGDLIIVQAAAYSEIAFRIA